MDREEIGLRAERLRIPTLDELSSPSKIDIYLEDLEKELKTIALEIIK
jgi:hypothetical protein